MRRGAWKYQEQGRSSAMILGVVSAFVVLSCQGKQPPATTSAQNRSAPAMSASERLTRDTASQPFGLTANPTSAGSDLLKELIQKADFDYLTSDERDSTVFVDFECHDGDCEGEEFVTFAVTPERRAHTVNWDNAIQQNGRPGYIVAQYQLITRVRVDSLGLEPGGVLYQWVGELTPFARGSALLNVNESDWTARFYKTSPAYETCDDPKGASRTTPAAKKKSGHTNCTPKSASSTGQAFTAAENLIPSGVWISCSNGCCESKGQVIASTGR